MLLAALLAAAEFRDPPFPLWAMELIATVFLDVWLFCMGATVGSFLNVVVFRLPRGKNLAYPGSLCPHCGHPIRLQDNIPLVSWLNLRGRCRDCGGPIASRYFWVELAVASLFLIVVAAEHYLPSVWFGLPARHLLSARDGAPFWCMYFLHAALITTLLAAVLIGADGFRVPAALFLPIACAAFALPLVWPEIRSVPAFPQQGLTRWQAGLVDGLLGLVAGLLTAISVMWPAMRVGWGPLTVLMFCCSITLVFGWQRGIPAAAFALPLCIVAVWLLPKSPFPITVPLPSPESAPPTESPTTVATTETVDPSI